MPLEIAIFSDISFNPALSSFPPDRIEVCTNYAVGGLTPPRSLLDALCTQRSHDSRRYDIHALIRPHANGFVYSETDIEAMKASIDELGQYVGGYVFGVLREGENGLELDVPQCKALIAHAQSNSLPLRKKCVLHRAVDEIVCEPSDLVNQVVAAGFDAVLMSGKAGTDAIESVPRIKAVVEAAAGRFEVIVGGGVRTEHIKELKQTGAKWFHSSAIRSKSTDMADARELYDLLDAVGRN